MSLVLIFRANVQTSDQPVGPFSLFHILDNGVVLRDPPTPGFLQ